MLDATKSEVVKRCDIFDRPPLSKGWTNGANGLLGNSVHPTMPNLGQGGAMAIEDAYVLGEELSVVKHSKDVNSILKAYER